MGGIRRRLLNNATSYEELWLGVSVNTVCRKSNDVVPFGKLDWTPQVIDGRCTMGQAEQVAIKKTVEIGLNFRSTHWGRLTYGRSAAPNRLPVSSGAGALAAGLYHGSIGARCLVSAATPC